MRKIGYYISNKSKSIKCIKENSTFSTIEELYKELNDRGWNSMTVFLKKQWNPDNKCSGQCNATVLLVQEYFGGDIISYPNPEPDKKGHYFNRIDGTDIDLTSEQFEVNLNYLDKTKKGSFGRHSFSCEKSAYIIKKNLGLL